MQHFSALPRPTDTTSCYNTLISSKLFILISVLFILCITSITQRFLSSLITGCLSAVSGCWSIQVWWRHQHSTSWFILAIGFDFVVVLKRKKEEEEEKDKGCCSIWSAAPNQTLRITDEQEGGRALCARTFKRRRWPIIKSNATHLHAKVTRAIDEQPNTTHNGAGPALHDK